MNAKLLLSVLAVFVAMIAAACIPAITDDPDPSLSAAQPVNNHPAMVLPVTGKAAPQAERNIQTNPDFKLHSSCISANRLRQDTCVEQEPAGTGLSSASSNSGAEDEQNTQSYPSPKTHSDCLSEDSVRQANCGGQ